MVEWTWERRCSAAAYIALAAAMAALVLWLFYARPVSYVYFINEDRWAEYGTFNLLAMACLFWLLALRTRPRDTLRKVGFWALLASSAFFALEEISWGQRVFGFGTPGIVAHHNWQSETNVHNLLYLDTTPVLAIGIALWLALTPLHARLPALARLIDRLGLPVVPYRVWPLFWLALVFAVSPLPKNDEITELCTGLALAVFAVDFAVGARWLSLGRARLAVGMGMGTIAVALTLTALMVATLDYPRHVLKLRLTDFAAERLPALGLNTQAAVIFEYLNDHPELRTDETDLRQAQWLVEQGRASDAGPILERVLVQTTAAQQANRDDPQPWRDEGRALRLLGERDSARRALLRAREIDASRLQSTLLGPAMASIRASLATTLQALGEPDVALTELDLAEQTLLDSEASGLSVDRRLRQSIQRHQKELRDR